MNKTIFITGASSGLGKTTVNLFAERGWTVIAAMRNIDHNEEVFHLPNVHPIKLDVNNVAEIALAVEQAEKICPVDVLFNNAGYALAGALEACTDEQMEHQFQTNVFGLIRLTRAFLPHFRARKSGVILTTTSLSGYIPDPFMALYSASKAAIENWTEGMVYELNRFSIRIKTIVPGLMQTNFVDNAQIAFHDDYQEDFNKMISFYNNPKNAASGDSAAEIANVVYEAATDGKNQLHYFAGNNAISNQKELNLYGIDALTAGKTQYFFE